MADPAPQPHDDRTGIAYATLAYLIWGVLPAYWRMFNGIPPVELTTQRIFWCALFVTALTAIRGHLPRVRAAIRQPGVLATLVLTSVLITINWTIYLYCVASDDLVEGSLGYYMTPLLSFVLGYLFFGEKLSRLRWAAIALAGAAVIVQLVALGRVPWIAPSLAVTFGLYGYFRKKTPIAGLDGLMVETVLLFPITAVLIGYWSFTGEGSFTAATPLRDVLLVIGGPLTAVPLALFAAGARLIRMTTLGFLQYLAPTITLVMAVFVLDEGFTTVDLVAFGCVWTALLIVALEGRKLPLPMRAAKNA